MFDVALRAFFRETWLRAPVLSMSRRVGNRLFFLLPTLSVMTCLVLIAQACGPSPRQTPSDLAAGWNGDNNPANLRNRYNTTLAALPQAAELERKPWSDSYWPSKLGGIAYRWTNQRPTFYYSLADANTVARMSDAQRSLLSPAEKYDIIQNRYDYPTVRGEWARKKPDDPAWYGLCHGLAPASIAFAEPGAVDIRAGVGGFVVPFGASDVKALLTYMRGSNLTGNYAGRRCNYDLKKEPWRRDDPECRGINAGSFHIILANQIGLMGQSYVAEVQRYGEIWNHAVYAYSTQLRRRSFEVYEDAAPGTTQLAFMRTRMHYIAATAASWTRQPLANNRRQAQARDYDYVLELNAQGQIIGGSWQTEDRPAFVWNQPVEDFTGYFRTLSIVYEGSIR